MCVCVCVCVRVCARACVLPMYGDGGVKTDWYVLLCVDLSVCANTRCISRE